MSELTAAEEELEVSPSNPALSVVDGKLVTEENRS